MARVAGQFKAKKKLLKGEGKPAVATMAAELDVSVPSLYNYLNEDDVPNGAVLERARELWDMRFDDNSLPIAEVEQSLRRAAKRKRREVPHASQYVLPFLDAVTQSDIKIVRVQAKKPSAVELVLNIKFGS